MGPEVEQDAAVTGEDRGQMDLDATCREHFRSMGFWAKVRLFAGRPKRFFYSQFRRGYVRANAGRREGECSRCGACCQLGSRCGFLYYEDGLACCKIHHTWKFPNCRIFPVDERDLADRDMILPEVLCGYRFNGKEGDRDRD